MENPATATTPAQSLLERLGQQLSTTATAQAVYGTPVERDGITVIPVARARYGFGGGSRARQRARAWGPGRAYRSRPWATSSCGRAAAVSGPSGRRWYRWWR